MTLTDDYLAAYAGHGPRASDVLTSARPSVTDTMYMGRCLSRPTFLERGDFRQLRSDLDQLTAALTGLPDRLFGGDLAAFAHAVGLAEPQVQAVVRGAGATPSPMARADMYRDEAGFHLLETNMGSAIGGLDNTELNRAMLEYPFISEFVTEHQLTYVETLDELVQSILIESKVATGTRPFVAAADWPDSYEELAAQLVKSARLLAPYGIDLQGCSLTELEYHDDRVWLDGRPVDVLYRLFLVEHVIQPDADKLIQPLLQAAERGEVPIFTPLDSELYGSKGALALLSDEAHRDRYTAEELAALDRILPWTRMVRPGPVTVDGAKVDLSAHALTNREELVLKPSAEHAGQGVVLGWQTDADTWREHVSAAMDGPYVLQQRIRPVPELFPTDDGVEPWVLTWGAILLASGFGGIWVRGSRELDGGVVNMATGATATCCFHQV